MRIMGWCKRCHRVRRVAVEVMPVKGGAAIGICDQCDDEAEREARR